MVSLRRRLVTTALVFASTVMASDAPPAALPRGFLEDLPVLMQLNQEEFELLLKYAEDSNSKNYLTEDNATKMNNGNNGEHDEN